MLMECKYCKNEVKKYTKKQMCNTHYLRWLRYGDPHFRKKKANGEGSISSQGYKTITINRKQVLLHRVILEKKLKRKLGKGEQCHHIDGNKLNNDPKNLSVTTNSEHHTIYHPMLKSLGKI